MKSFPELNAIVSLVDTGKIIKDQISHFQTDPADSDENVENFELITYVFFKVAMRKRKHFSVSFIQKTTHNDAVVGHSYSQDL